MEDEHYEPVADEPDEGGPLCPSCFRPVEPTSDFCPHCHAHIAAYTGVDPFNRIRFTRPREDPEASSPVSLIVLLGIVTAFGLFLAGQGLILLIQIAAGADGVLADALLSLLVAAVLLAIGGYGFVKTGRKHQGSDQDSSQDQADRE